ALAELGDLLGLEALARGGVLLLGDLALVEDLDSPLRAHDGDLGGRPGEVEVGPDVLRGHDAVGSSIGLARDDRELGDGGLGERVKELRAVPDDASELLRWSRQEARDVFEDDERDVEGIAEADEARALDGRVDVEGAGEMR